MIMDANSIGVYVGRTPLPAIPPIIPHRTTMLCTESLFSLSGQTLPLPTAYYHRASRLTLATSSFPTLILTSSGLPSTLWVDLSRARSSVVGSPAMPLLDGSRLFGLRSKSAISSPKLFADFSVSIAAHTKATIAVTMDQSFPTAIVHSAALRQGRLDLKEVAKSAMRISKTVLTCQRRSLAARRLRWLTRLSTAA